MKLSRKTRLPLPFLGYLFILLGFVGLGLFVAALAFGAPSAPVLGVGMVAAYGAGVACFMLRKWRIGHADPSADFTLGFDPIRGDIDRRAERRYLQTYRGRSDTPQARGDEPSRWGTRDGHNLETPVAGSVQLRDVVVKETVCRPASRIEFGQQQRWPKIVYEPKMNSGS